MFDTCSFNMMRKDVRKLEGSADENGFVWVDPVPDLITGEIKGMAELNNVQPVRLGGCWVGKRGGDGKAGQRAQPGEKVIYELHGGAYVAGDASVKGMSGYLCKETLKAIPQFSRAFIIDYRLCQAPPLPPQNAFPAALLDALAGYNYLVNVLGFDPTNIMVLGESAGGHLALVLVRYLLLHVPSLNVPGGLLLLSPTVDRGSWNKNPNSSFFTNYPYDCLHAPFKTDYVARSLLGNLPAAAADTNAWISPASRFLTNAEGMFTGFPPTMLVTGGAEMTLDPMRTLRDRLEADIGKRLTYLEVDGASHVFMMWRWHEPEKSEGFAHVDKWAGTVFG